MKIKNGILVAVAVVVLSGCCYIRWTEPMYRISDGRFFPKKPQFAVVPSRASQHCGLDYSSIYVWQRLWEYEGQAHTNYYHVRFWPTGECIAKGSTDKQIHRDDIEDFLWGKGWSMGFYEMNGSNVVFEIYVPDAYNKYYGVVSSNEIHVTQINLKYATAKFSYDSYVDQHYLRYPIGKLNDLPDWSVTGMLHRAVEINIRRQ